MSLETAPSDSAGFPSITAIAIEIDSFYMSVETDEPNCGSLIHGPVLPVSALL
jgi:hypothetical protein